MTALAAPGCFTVILMIFRQLVVVLAFTAFNHLERIRFTFAGSSLGLTDSGYLGHCFLGRLNLWSGAAGAVSLVLHNQPVSKVQQPNQNEAGEQFPE